MVVINDAGLLAVSALIAAGSFQKKRCRERLRSAVDRLETAAPGTSRGQRVASDAATCIRTACAACARCPGI